MAEQLDLMSLETLRDDDLRWAIRTAAFARDAERHAALTQEWRVRVAKKTPSRVVALLGPEDGSFSIRMFFPSPKACAKCGRRTNCLVCQEGLEDLEEEELGL